MNRVLKVIKKGFAYGFYLSVPLIGAGACYYQYIYYVLGPILLISKEESIKYYT